MTVRSRLDGLSFVDLIGVRLIPFIYTLAGGLNSRDGRF